MDYFGYCLLFVTLISFHKCISATSGPVFVNSFSPTTSTFIPIVPTTTGYVTQTVYGFLDFTTTIGDTVMVFSPQSSSAAESSTPSIEPIKPTKTVEKKIPLHTTVLNQPILLETPKKVESPLTKPTKKLITPASVKKVVINDDQLFTTHHKETEVLPAIRSVVDIISTPTLESHVETTVPPVLSSIVEIKTDDEPAIPLGNNIGDPEYDFLSRQPSEVVEETYKVISLKPSSKLPSKPKSSIEYKQSSNKGGTKRLDTHPTGLVTKLGGTVVKDGVTTVHETSVIGTYISGKYAQVLQSTSHTHSKAKITPSPTLRILKTAAPTPSKTTKYNRHLEPTPAGSIQDETALPPEISASQQNYIKSTKKLTSGGSSYKPRYKSKPKDLDVEEVDSEADSLPHHKKFNRNRNQNPTTRYTKHNTAQNSPHKFGRGTRKTTTTSKPSVHSEEATSAPSYGTGKRYQSRRNKQFRLSNTNNEAGGNHNNNNNNNNNGGFSRRGYKPKIQTSSVEQTTATTTSLYKFKLNRQPGRWQYKTTPKPRVTIRKQSDDEQNIVNSETAVSTPVASLQNVSALINDLVTPETRSDDSEGLEGSESIASIIDDENSTENKLDTPFPLETLKVEISTPPDFKDIYYEIATIKSPYTFQVGNVKNTRYITVTSTIEKNLASTTETTVTPTLTEPLTENILASTSHYAKDHNFLDSSIATLPPIYLASDVETPPLETITETFSTTHTLLKTHILPIIWNGNSTSSSTLIQTYLVERVVTATKTLPPMEAYHFIPSKTLNEFNSRLDEAGSELHLELEFGDSNEQDEETVVPNKAFPPDLDLANVGTDFDLSDVDRSKLPEGPIRVRKIPLKTTTTTEAPPQINSEQLQQLALLRLFNPAAQAPVITTSKPILKVETVYESHIIPITNGGNTILTTISKVLGTVTKTDYEFGTSTIVPPALPLPPMPLAPVNPLFPQAQFALTSSPVIHNTLVTQTNSKVLKLTFGAKTAYTTIFSTKVVPTTVTSYFTASVPVHPTAAFPGYFPAAYPAYPFVG